MNLSIQRRLTLGSLFLYALMMGSAILGLYHLTRINEASEAILEDNHESVRHMQALLALLADGRVANMSDIVAMDSIIRQQERNITEPGEAASTAALRADFDRWRAVTVRTTANATALIKDVAAIQGLNLDAIDRKSGLSRAIGRRALFWLFLLTLLVTLVGLGFSVAFPSVMSAPIVRLREAVRQMAAHNYRHRIPPFRMKELDDLGKAFNQMARELELYDDSNMARMMADKIRAEAVINSLQDASIGVSEEGVVLFANQQALELLGTGVEGVVGHHATDLALRNDLFSHILSEKAGVPFKVVVGGKENYFAGSSVPISGSAGSLGQLHVLHNITPYQERDLAKTNFLATISHELKTPLASTDIGLALLERDPSASLSAEQLAILSDLRKDHQRLVRIVSELLDLSQAESGNIRVQLTTLRLSSVVQEALAAVKVSAQQKNVRFQAEPEAPGISILGDADKTVWVLVNLLSNAVRHSPEGGVVRIRTEVGDASIGLVVTDAGSGISPADQARLFERFSHGTSSHKGTGLGLSIAREFMQAMGGTISFDPTTAEGAAFTLTFTPAQ